MNRTDFVLACMTASRKPVYSPIQVQKLFFLIDRNISEEVGGPYFDFSPYLYGPFDGDLYVEIERLIGEGYVERTGSGRLRSYGVTIKGTDMGHELQAELNERATGYIVTAARFVQSLTFGELVTAIYRAYPEMKVNSIFS